MNPEPLPQIVKRRVDGLLEMAREAIRHDEGQAARYVKLARALAARHRLALGRGRKHLFCKACNRPWVAGFNVKVRLRSRMRQTEYACVCGATRRFGYAPKASKQVRNL